MLALEDLPPPSDATFVALIGLVVLFWIGMRVHLLRRAMARRNPGAPPPEGAAWLRRLAAWPGTYPALYVLGAGFVALLFV